MNYLRTVHQLIFVVALSCSSMSGWAFGQEPSKKEEPQEQAALVVHALKNARDELSIKRQKLSEEYTSWRKQSPLLLTTLNPEAAIERGNRKLDRLEEQRHAVQNELRELQLQEEMIKVRRKHLESRFGDIEHRRAEQVSTLNKLTNDARKDTHFREEIANHKALFDAVVEKLFEVDLSLQYGKPLTKP